MDELAARTQRVVESILENESLTADLDDRAARVLLDWGVARSRKIVGSTSDLDDREAEETMYPRLRALRRLMRSVNRWIANRSSMDVEAGGSHLEEVITQAKLVYGQGFVSPAPDSRLAFLRFQADLIEAPAQFIIRLRDLLENPQRGLPVDWPTLSPPEPS